MTDLFGQTGIAGQVQSEKAYGPIYSAQYQDAAKSAKANELGHRLGIPADIVDADIPNMMAADRVNRAITHARQNAAYAKMMSNPRLAASGIDDHQLPKVASAVSDHTNLVPPDPISLQGAFVGRLLSGVADIFSGFSGVAHAFDETNPNLASTTLRAASLNPAGAILPLAMRLFGKAHDRIDAVSNATRYSTGNRTIDDVLSGVETVPSNLAALGATVLAGPVGGAAFFGAQGFGESYEEGRKAGLNPDHSAMYGAGDAAIQAGTMFLPEKYLGGVISGKGGAVKAVGSGLGLNAVATGLQGLNHWYWIDRPKGVSFHQFVSALPDEERSAMVSTMVALGATAGVGHVIGKAANQAADTQANQSVDSVMDAAAKSSTRTANPSDFEAALNQLVGDSTASDIYVPADKVLDLFQPQEGKPARDLRSDPFWGQYAPQIEEAGTLGGDVVVPLSAAATHLAGSTDWAALREHVRTRPGGASLSEVSAAQSPEELTNLASQVAGHLDEAVPHLKAVGLSRAFADALGYNGDQANAVSQLMGAGLSRAYALEKAKREAHGEPVPTMEEFAQTYLPEAEKTTQAAYDARRSEGVTAEAAQSELGQPVHLTDLPHAADVPSETVAAPQVSIGDLRASAKDFYEKNFSNLEVTASNGLKVRFHKRGLEKTTRVGERLLRAIPAIPSVIENGVALKPLSGRDRGTVAVHRYGAFVNVGGDSFPVAVYVRETRDGNFHYSLHDWNEATGRSAEAEGGTAEAVAAPAIEGAPGEGKIAKGSEDFNDSQRRGNISIARDDQGMMTNAVIRAFEHADFSTSVHEIGHFFLEDLKRRSLGDNATEQEKADFETVKSWMAENGHTVEDNAIPEGGHETFARGFERYIYEGQAPSKGLKPLFAKMRDFMISLYRSIRAFNSPISPEIRKVMDRLLASDDEIAARREELRLGDQALTDLMSGEEQTRYAELGDEARSEARDKLFDRVLSTIRSERTRAVASRRSEIRQEISDNVDAQPIFKALKLLRSGVPQEDGSTARATIPRQWFIDNYGEDALSKLPKGVPPIVDDAHGVDPEGLAHDAGFESADQMVQKLTAHEDERQLMKAKGDGRSPRRALVEDMTSERLRDEIGDPFANLEEEADSALANEKQADRLSLELRALSRKTGKAPVPWKMAMEWARGHVRSSSSKDSISGAAMQMYAKSASKAAQNVEEALVKGDYEAAFRAKQQQVLNLALMAQAKEAKDEVLKAVKRMRNTARRETIASVDQEYLDQAHQLLEAVDMKSRSGKAVDRRMAFEAWHAKQVANDVEPIVPPEYRSILGSTHWSRLTINDLLDLDKAVKQIVQLGRLKQELKDGKRKRDYNEAVSEMQDRGGQVPPRKRRGGTTDPRKSPIGRAASRLRSIDAAMVKTEQLCIWLDNHDPNGPWQRLLYRPFAEAQGRYSDLFRQYGKDINGLIKNMPKSAIRALTRTVDTPELVIKNNNHIDNGMPFHGTKDQILSMALNWGNLGNRQRLLDGFGWDEQSVAKVFDRTLTKDDWNLVQGVWDTVDKLWPDVAKLERDVNGVEPEKVEAAEVPTPHGTYRGGYFPIVYDPMQTTHTDQVNEDKIAPSGGWWSISTRSSATKERAEQVKGRPLLLSMSVITHHMHEVIHDITHRQAVNQARRLLGDDRVSSVINTRMGPEYTKAARAWLENVAKPNSAYSRANPAVLWLARYLNKAITTVGLGFRVTVSFKQLLGIPFSAKELGSDNVGKGMGIVMAHPVKAYQEMVERSAEMRARSDALDASIEDMREDMAKGKLKQIGPRGISKYAFQGIVWTDVISRTTVWTSAYNKGLKENMSEDDAVSYADRSVRQSHGIGFQKDRAGIQYDHPIARAMWPFFSYLNALYNAQRDVGHRVARAETAGDYGEAARRAWWVFMVPALLQAVFFDDGPDSGTVGDWADYLGKGVMLGNFASLPVVGNVAQSLGKGYGYRAISYQSIGEDIGKAAKAVKRAAEGDGELSGATIKSVLNAVGEITAKPLGQIGATSGGLYDYATGTADPQTVGDWYNLLTRGSIPPHPTAAERIAGRKE